MAPLYYLLLLSCEILNYVESITCKEIPLLF